MKQATTPKAFINVKDLGFAPIESETGGTVTFGEPIQTRGLKSVGLPTGGDITLAWADGSPIESAVGEGEPTLTLGLHQLPIEVEEMIFNTAFDTDGIAVEEWGAQPKPVAVWFKRERKDGSYTLHGFPKVLFSRPAEETTAKEGSVEFGQMSIEGRIMRPEDSNVKHIKADSSKSETFEENNFFQKLINQTITVPGDGA